MRCGDSELTRLLAHASNLVVADAIENLICWCPSFKMFL